MVSLINFQIWAMKLIWTYLEDLRFVYMGLDRSKRWTWTAIIILLLKAASKNKLLPDYLVDQLVCSYAYQN